MGNRYEQTADTIFKLSKRVEEIKRSLDELEENRESLDPKVFMESFKELCARAKEVETEADELEYTIEKLGEDTP